jgi:ethanolamine utilization protein EutP (predicted NTPase)
MRRFLFLVLASGLCANVASAKPVLWTLQGVTFNDGGTASGSFVYDAYTNTYSSINITTTDGTAPGPVSMAGATYRFLDPGVVPVYPRDLIAVVTATGDLSGVPVLAIVFASDLTDTAGTVPLEPGFGEGVCTSSNCSTLITNRSVSAGSLNGQAVTPAIPSLSTWGLLGTALLLCASAFFVLRKNVA